MKVGMITIYRKNYGAFLQCYALQQALIKTGCEPEIIRYDYYKDHTCFGVAMASKPSLRTLLKAAIVEIVRFFPHRKRLQVFDSSVALHIRESDQYYRTYSDLANNPPEYDVYLTGSDQVFNPKLSPQSSPARRLEFVKKGVKASYAASSGTNEIDARYKKEFMQALSTFKGISVREEGLAQYIKKEYELDAFVHIDPVFLLNKEEWSHFSQSIDYLKGEYIFYYRVLPQRELNETAAKLSEMTGLPIFVADGHDKFKHQIRRKGFLSPEQWVYAINNAAYVVTNSFHGAAFATNLGKRACLLIPPKGGERVTTLLKNCKLDFMICNPLYMLENVFFDYTDANLYLRRECEKSMRYLSEICSKL